MLCPRCQKTLQEQKISEAKYTLHRCPSNHGVLLSGGVLGEVKDLDNAEIARIDSVAHTPKNQPVICPHCNKPMTHVNFNDTEIFIDACPTSPLRWLDSGELQKIKDYEPDLSDVNAQALLRQIALAPTLDTDAFQKQVNPNITVLPVAHGRNLRGFALMVVIKALLHSKYTRIFLLVILVIAAIVYALVLKEFQ